MDQIPFDVWFYSIKDVIDLKYVRKINPFHGNFYRHGDCFFQLVQITPEEVAICQAFSIGKRSDFGREILKLARSYKYEKVIFMTSEFNKQTKALARYWGFSLRGSEPDYYGSGEDALVFEIDLTSETNKRIQ